jgi:hypothetical protein
MGLAVKCASDLGLFALIAFSLTLAASLIVWFAVPELADLFALVFSVALSVLYVSGVVMVLRARRRRDS